MALNFQEATEILEAALTAESGFLRVDCRTHGGAMNTRARLNYWRTKDREGNTATYPADHPLHAHSVYDVLILRISEYYILIERREPTIITFEEVPAKNAMDT